MTRSWPAAVVAVALFAAIAAATLASASLVAVPQPPPSALEGGVRQELASAHQQVAALHERGAGSAELGEAYGELGRLYAAYELDESAAACFANARELAPRDPRWPYYLAYVEQRQGAFERAAAALEATLALAPDGLPARLRLGEVRLALGDLTAARGAFERALAAATGPGAGDAGAAAAHFGLGRVLAAGTDPAAAAEHFRRALELQPAATRVHYLLAQAYRRLGETAEARRHLALRGDGAVHFADPLIEALTVGAGGGALAKFEGDQAVLAGRLAAAATAYGRAVAADPGRFAYRKSLGSTLYHLGRVEEARTELTAALDLEPEGTPAERARQRAEVRHALGGIAANRGRIATAERHFSAATELDPGWPQPWLDLANLRGRAGRLEEALSAFDRVLELDPGHPEARLQRATTLMDLGRFAAAIPDLEERLRLLPGDGRARQLLEIARRRAANDR